MGRFYRIIFLLGILIPQYGRAQTIDCEQTIALATEEYNAGHFYNVPSMLNECLTRFNRDQRQRAFLLLTQTYLLLDDPIGAQRSYLEVLWANPEFLPDEKLHAIDIVYLSKRFTATPKFSWFVGAGTNVSVARLIHDIDIADDDNESYSLRPGYSVGVGGEYSYNDNLKVRLEANFFQTSYQANAGQHFDWDRKTVIDRQSWVNIPAYLCYSDNVGTYRPYGYIGYSVSSMLADKASITLEEIDKGTSTQEGEEPETKSTEVTSPDFDFLERRNRINQSVIFGGGVRYKVGLDFVFVELRYSAGLKNIIKPEYIYGNPTYDRTSAEWVMSSTSATGFAHADDLFRLDNISISFGFLRPLYKPRELKRARTNGVLRRMKRVK